MNSYDWSYLFLSFLPTSLVMFRSIPLKLKNKAFRLHIACVPRMEMKGISLFLFAFFSLILHASAQETFVSLGSGGGFAGTATVYKVTPKGLIFKGTGMGDIKFDLCGKIKKARAREIIASVNNHAHSVTEFNHPGNLYYFITYSENQTQQTITWGDVDHPVPDEIKKLYDDIHSTVSEIKYRPIN